MKIRLAEEADAGEVVRLVSALLVELGGKSLEPQGAAAVCHALVSRPELGFAILAESPQGGRAVCTVSFVHALRSSGRYAIVQEMYVAPELRGSGIGKRVLDTAIARARDAGCPFIELGTPLHGTRQIEFYRRSGFVSVGERLRCVL